MSIVVLMFFVSMIMSIIGFKKYIWFISIGYGFAIAAIGLVSLIRFASSLTFLTTVLCLLIVVYGCRLGGFLLIREVKSTSYNQKMKTETKDGSTMPIIAKVGIWVGASLLYTCECAPVYFRLLNHTKNDVVLVIGMIMMILGLVVESVADYQKNQAKRVNPHRFVDTGLYKIVRCPNYFGEMLFWTGVLVTGFLSLHGIFQWSLSLLGFAGIIFVMFSGARRLEMRQNRTYGHDPEYQNYVKTTPIMIPFVPLYSVEQYKWLVA